MTRTLALLGKELADLRRNPAVFLPGLFTGLMSILMPFFMAIVVPALSGEPLSESRDFQRILERLGGQPPVPGLDQEGVIQAWLFQQFLVLLVLAPIAASMSVAAYSVIGEKQSRTLEPLLATPITTLELLAAKVLGSLLPALALTLGCYLVYVASVTLVARPGVFVALFSPSALAVVFVLGPLAALAALQLAVCVSSRVHDVRSAQQIGALVILPVVALLVGQLTGRLTLTVPFTLSLAVALAGINVALALVAIRLFDRESILTRWK